MRAAAGLTTCYDAASFADFVPDAAECQSLCEADETCQYYSFQSTGWCRLMQTCDITGEAICDDECTIEIEVRSCSMVMLEPPPPPLPPHRPRPQSPPSNPANPPLPPLPPRTPAKCVGMCHTTSYPWSAKCLWIDNCAWCNECNIARPFSPPSPTMSPSAMREDCPTDATKNERRALCGSNFVFYKADTNCLQQKVIWASSMITPFDDAEDALPVCRARCLADPRCVGLRVRLIRVWGNEGEMVVQHTCQLLAACEGSTPPGAAPGIRLYMAPSYIGHTLGEDHFKLEPPGRINQIGRAHV